MLLAVDPGLRGCGVASFYGNTLFCAKYVPNPDPRDGPLVWSAMARAIKLAHPHFATASVDTLVLEIPRIYPGHRQKGDQNDLIQLAGVQGAVVASQGASHVVGVFPSEWKGTVPKRIFTERIRKALTEDERLRIVSAGHLDHNTLDAIGLGLWKLGRLHARGADSGTIERRVRAGNPGSV